MIRQDIIELFRVPPGKKIRLRDYNPGWAQTKEMKELGKDDVKARAKAILEKNLEDLAKAQKRLWADDRYAVLVVLQALDAAGKDGTIKHVMSGVNPQGCQVFSFKKPSAEELDHNFLWRYMRCLPERGRIGIFNRSYYEDVLVVKVHPELLTDQKLPPGKQGKAFWEARYRGHLCLRTAPGAERHHRPEILPERLQEGAEAPLPGAAGDPGKHWKFSASDLAERGFWDQYTIAYEDALSATSTEWAPWYIVPADHKWATRAVVADILTTAMLGLDLRYPEVTEAQHQALEQARQQLEHE